MIKICQKTLSMIVPKEINENDIVKLLVNEEGMEEEMYGVVAMNTGLTLGMHYLNPTEMFYKSACVYKLDDGNESSSLRECQNIILLEPFEDLEMKPLGTNMSLLLWDWHEDPDSDIYDKVTIPTPTWVDL